MPPLTRQLVTDQLGALGITGGDVVMMHSSLSALGPVDDGAETVVDGILDAIGADGTLLVPAFRDSVWGDPADFTNSDCDCTSEDGLCPSQQPGFQGVLTDVFAAARERCVVATRRTRGRRWGRPRGNC